MAFKPNYNFQKAERARAKAQKKQEKLKRKAELRGDGQDGETGASDTDEAGTAAAETSSDAETSTDGA